MCQPLSTTNHDFAIFLATLMLLLLAGSNFSEFSDDIIITKNSINTKLIV